jgi:hypothetical protein
MAIDSWDKREGSGIEGGGEGEESEKMGTNWH